MQHQLITSQSLGSGKLISSGIVLNSKNNATTNNGNPPPMRRVQLHLRASKLKNISHAKWRGKVSSPYIQLLHVSSTNNSSASSNAGELIGQTEVQHANLSPQFTTPFILNHSEWTNLRIIIRDCRASKRKGGGGQYEQRSVRRPLGQLIANAQNITTLRNNNNNNAENDHDVDNEEGYYKQDDPIISQVDIEINQILTCPGQQTDINLNEGGKLYVQAVESIHGRDTGIIDVHIRGLDVKNIESGLLGLGAVDPYFIISKKYNDTKSGISNWIPVYQSEHIHDIINPYWKPFKLNLEHLCNNDITKQLKITIYDQEQYGSDRWLGEVGTSVKELLESVATRGNADRERALRVVAVEDDGKEDLRALLVILRAEVTSE